MVVFENLTSCCVTLVSATSRNRILVSVLVLFYAGTAVLDANNNQMCREIFCQNKHKFDHNFGLPESETLLNNIKTNFGLPQPESETLLSKMKTKESQLWMYRNYTKYSARRRSTEIYQYKNQLGSKNRVTTSTIKYNHSKMMNNNKSGRLVFSRTTKYRAPVFAGNQTRAEIVSEIRPTSENEKNNITFDASFLENRWNIPHGNNVTKWLNKPHGNNVTNWVNILHEVESIDSEDNVSEFRIAQNSPPLNILKRSVPILISSVNIVHENSSEKNVSLFKNEPHTWESGENSNYLVNDTGESEEDYNSTAEVSFQIDIIYLCNNSWLIPTYGHADPPPSKKDHLKKMGKI